MQLAISFAGPRAQAERDQFDEDLLKLARIFKARDPEIDWSRGTVRSNCIKYLVKRAIDAEGASFDFDSLVNSSLAPGVVRSGDGKFASTR